MRAMDDFYRNNRLSNPDDIDALLEVAEITRHLLFKELYSDICQLICYTVQNGYYEAFSWMMAVLQEEYEKPENTGLTDFSCELGRSIPQYNEFTRRLDIDFNVIDNDFEKAYDHHGEVQSFFNIYKYKTAYKNIFLVTEENFDLMDNDFIRYKLLISRCQEKN